MPKVSKDSAAHVEDHGVVEDRHEDIDGYTTSFVTFRQDIDATPLLKGLPGDSCPCPHWGYVIKGRLTYRFADHEEVFAARDRIHLAGRSRNATGLISAPRQPPRIGAQTPSTNPMSW